MKKLLLVLPLLVALCMPIPAADMWIGSFPIAFTFFPQKPHIPNHIANPTEFQSRVLITSYQEYTYLRATGYHEQGAPHMQEGFFFSIGDVVPLLRIHARDNEDLGIGFQGSWMMPFFTDSSWIAMGMEFVIDLGVTASFHPAIGLKASRKHICSHLLDRSLFTDGDGFLGTASSDVDPHHGPMAIRDSAVFSVHLAPEKIFFPTQEIIETSFYFDYGFSLPGDDPFGAARYTRPAYRSSRYYQYGAQATIHLDFGRVNLGSFYIAGNISHFEDSGYAPNTAYSVGYILPYHQGKRSIRIDYSYYDGRAILEEYYGHRERFTSIGLKLFM